jgi:hypothetical protein
LCSRPGFPVFMGDKVRRLCEGCSILDQEMGWAAVFAAAGTRGCCVCAGKPDHVTKAELEGGGLQAKLVLVCCSKSCQTETKTVLQCMALPQAVCSRCGKTAARMGACALCRDSFCSKKCLDAAMPAHKEVCVPWTPDRKAGQSAGKAGKAGQPAGKAGQPAERAPDEARCKVCRRARPLLSCGRCGKADYCGNLCQKLDWVSEHHALCPGPRGGAGPASTGDKNRRPTGSGTRTS